MNGSDTSFFEHLWAFLFNRVNPRPSLGCEKPHGPWDDASKTKVDDGRSRVQREADRRRDGR